MRLIPGSCPPTIESLSAVIAHSQIVVAQPYRAVSSLPAGFDYVDVACSTGLPRRVAAWVAGLLPI